MDTLTAGYVAAMMGQNPNEKFAYSGSSYETGYLLGFTDREAGKVLPKFHGYCDEAALPIKAGMEVTIRKGTIVKTIGKDPKPAGKTYKVRVNHILPGRCMYADRGGVSPMMNPRVVWAGPGGYWSEVDMNDVPEAQ